MTTEPQLSEARKAYIRSRIELIVVNEQISDLRRIYIDFHGKHRPHWYVMFLPQERAFGRCIKLNRDDVGQRDVPEVVRRFLLTLIPSDILATCTAVAITGRWPSGRTSPARSPSSP